MTSRPCGTASLDPAGLHYLAASSFEFFSQPRRCRFKLVFLPIDGLLDLLDPQVRMLVQLPHLERPGLAARLDLEACRGVYEFAFVSV